MVHTGGDDLAYWLALNRAPGMGPRAIRQLLAAHSVPRDIFDLARHAPTATLPVSPQTLAYLRCPDWRAVEQDLAWLERSGCIVLPLQHPHYPALLGQIHDPPPLLFVRGDPDLLFRPQMAIVGSRNPSVQGREIAFDFAHCLAAAGLAVTSGLAAGVDAAAHRGALAVGGVTIAVLGTGLDRVYPARHRPLADEIALGGALLSEFPPRTVPRAENFPRRNRLISGLSLGTLVVEAAARSGSLITARCATEQGREVFAVPGSIHNPLARGCHRLIRDGAKLVETVDDILEELGPLVHYVAHQRPPAAAAPTEAALPAHQQRLMDALGFDPAPMNVLIERSGLTAEEVSSMLLVLELQGYVTAAPGGQFCRNKA